MGKNLKGREIGKGISQQKDGLYVGRYTDLTGKRVVRRFQRLQDCQQWINDKMYAKEHGNVLGTTMVTVDAWYEWWIELKAKTVKESTITTLKRNYKVYIKPIIGNMLISDVKPMHCQQICNAMGEKNLKSSTISNIRNEMHNLFEIAVDNDIIIKNPCGRSVVSAVGNPTTKKMALNKSEQTLLVANCASHRYGDVYKFILQTGLRIGELIGLQWDDIDFANKIMHIKRSASYDWDNKEWRLDTPKTISGIRTVPLNDEAIQILNDRKMINAQMQIVQIEWAKQVFIGSNGKPIPYVMYDTALKKLAKKIGLRKLSPHLLRHTFATRCIEAGMPPKTLQSILGHSKLEVTMNLYVTVTDESKVSEMNKIAEELLLVQ